MPGNEDWEKGRRENEQEDALECVFMIVLFSLVCCGVIKCCRIMKKKKRCCSGCGKRLAKMGQVVATENIPNMAMIVNSEPVQPVFA